MFDASKQVLARGGAVLLATAALLGLTPTLALAQAAAPAAPEPPPPTWTGSAGFGLSITSGNTDTQNLNLTFDTTRDPKTRTVLKFQGSYLFGSTDGERTVDRTGLSARIQYALNPRTYVFGQLQFLRDTFKDIDYLWAPGGGLGYKLIDTPAVTLAADAGLGVVFEKNPGFDLDTSGAFSAGDKLTVKLTDTASLTQNYSGLWKFSDFGDSIHAFGVGLAASINSRTQLKVEFLDTYKAKPTAVTIKKNDVAFVTSIVFKF